METLNVMDVLGLMPTTKEQINDFASQAIISIKSGELDVLHSEIQLKIIEETINAIRLGIRDSVIREYEKYHEKEVRIFDSIISVSERKVWDYSKDWKIQELKAKTKAREEMLKSLTDPVADPETGEMIYPANHKTSTVLTIKL